MQPRYCVVTLLTCIWQYLSFSRRSPSPLSYIRVQQSWSRLNTARSYLDRCFTYPRRCSFLPRNARDPCSSDPTPYQRGGCGRGNITNPNHFSWEVIQDLYIRGRILSPTPVTSPTSGPPNSVHQQVWGLVFFRPPRPSGIFPLSGVPLPTVSRSQSSVAVPSYPHRLNSPHYLAVARYHTVWFILSSLNTSRTSSITTI